MLVELFSICFEIKYEIFSEQYNEIIDLGFNTLCSFYDTKCNIL